MGIHTDRVKWKYSENNQSQCHFVQKKCLKNLPEIEPIPRGDSPAIVMWRAESTALLKEMRDG
jgi:hypothetical protein